MSKLNEDNIKEYIDQRLPHLSWSEIFFEMKKEVEEIMKSKNKDFVSIQHNFNPIFLYYAIEDKCPLTEFAKILQISKNYEIGLNRFFERPDGNYGETNSIYNKMDYVFYKKEKEHIVFDKNKLPYLYAIIKNVRKQNLLEFHSSRISFFLCHVIEKNNSIGKELMEVILQTPNMLMEEHTQYLSMPMSIMKNIAERSYDEDVSAMYQLFKENHQLYTLLKNGIIKSDKINKYQTNLSIYQIIFKNEINYFDILMTRVKEFKKILNRKEYINLVEDTFFSIENSVKEKPFKFNMEDVNLDADLLENIPYLLVLQKIIESGQYHLIEGVNKKLNDYIKVTQEKNKDYKSNENGSNYDIVWSVLENVDLIKIEKFFQLQNLNKKLPTKENRINKPKI